MGSLDSKSDMEFDVCIIGAGPVGAYLAVRLAREGLRVGIFDALSTPSLEPRAVVHMPILFQEYGSIDILEKMREISKIHSGAICFRQTRDSEMVEKIQPNPNRPGPLAVPQGIFSQMLLGKLNSSSTARVFLGHRFVESQEAVDGINIQVEDVENKETYQVFCKYLVGADGSKSLVRGAMGERYDGTTIPYKLIAANIVFPFEEYGYDGANYMLDPEDFGMIAHVGTTADDRSLWRVSTSFPIAMSDDEIMQDLPSKLQKLCEHLKHGTYEVLTARPYVAHQLSTSTMFKGRILLVGDAAHLSNPYAGQSMAAGIFDASSLAECLVPILRHGASPSLLEEWSQDRVLKIKTILHPLSVTCFNAVKDPDTDSIGQRFPLLKAMKAGPAAMASMPTLRTDVSKFKSWKVDSA